MSESTLKITFTEIRTELGRYLDLDRTYASWSADEVADVTECIKRGLRNFYFPMKTNVNEPAHRWSFLRPSATLVIWDDIIEDDEITATIVFDDPNSTVTASEAAFYPSMVGKSLVCVTSGNSYTITGYTSSTVIEVEGDASGDTGDTITIDSGDTFTLPWDFGGMSGNGGFTYDRDSNKIFDINLTSDVNIRKLRQASISPGAPTLAAVIPKSTDGTQGQRWEAAFYPPPNSVLTLHYRYYILPDALVLTTLEYPYGSAAHSGTILESCLAVAESREKDGGDGSHQARFEKLLVASIDHDKSLGEAITHFGYNGDNSDGVDETGGHNFHPSHYNEITGITVNGTYYE